MIMAPRCGAQQKLLRIRYDVAYPSMTQELIHGQKFYPPNGFPVRVEMQDSIYGGILVRTSVPSLVPPGPQDYVTSS